jgi:hypothetical protein
MTTTDDIVGRLARFASGLQLGGLPETLVQRAKCSVMDALAAGLYGSAQAGTETFRRYVAGQSGSAQAHVWAGGQTTTFYAAMTNAMMIDLSGIAQRHETAGLRPSTLIVPALIGAGDRERTPGSELLIATIVGYEVLLRLNRVVGGALAAQGLDPSIVGTIASAAAVSRLMQLGEADTATAMGIAASLTPTALPAAISGTVADLSAAHAGALGVMAAELTRVGAVATPGWAEAWFRAVPRVTDLSGVDDGLGQEWVTLLTGLITTLDLPDIVTASGAVAANDKALIAGDVTLDQLATKLRAAANGLLPLPRYETLISTVRTLEKLPNVRTLTALMSPQAGLQPGRIA